MGVTSNITFSTPSNVGNQLVATAAVDIPQDSFFRREDKEGIKNLAHNHGQIVLHPEYPFMHRGTNSLILTRGTGRLIYKWTENDDLTTQQVDQFRAYLASVFPSSEGHSIVMDIPNKTITVSVVAAGDLEEFSNVRPHWGLNCSFAEISFDEGADLLCVLRTSEDKDSWETLYRDGQKNSEVTVRRVGEECYVIFGRPVIKDGTSLQAFKPYKLTSDEITVTCPEFTKIIRVHKNGETS